MAKTTTMVRGLLKRAGLISAPGLYDALSAGICKQVVSKSEMPGKLKAALDARDERDPAFVIMCRRTPERSTASRTRSIASRRPWTLAST